MPDTSKNSAKTAALEQAKFKGKYITAVGRRKTAIAQVRLYKDGSGIMTVNGMGANLYFQESELFSIINQPLKLTGLTKDFNISAIVTGGGKKGKADAVRHGISRALMEVNPELRPSLKVKGYIMRDARKKERKKPGLKKARKAPQWAKR